MLCPKKLRENWTNYTVNDKRNLLADDRFNYDVLNHTDLTRITGKSGEINLQTINWGNYDVTKEEDCSKLADAAIESFGKINLVAPFAGIIKDGMMVSPDRETGKITSKMSLEAF